MQIIPVPGIIKKLFEIFCFHGKADTIKTESVINFEVRVYQHRKKWQKKVAGRKKAYAASNHSDKPKFYALVEFPYPSGQGLHVGHARPYTAMDVVAARKRMDGYNVLFPIGYDALVCLRRIMRSKTTSIRPK